MRNLRWITLLALLALVLAACGGGGGGGDEPEGTGPAATGATGEDAQAACDEDEFGCVEIADGENVQIGTALSITGDTASLGLDSQWGAQVAVNFKNDDGGLFGREIELINEDAGCAEAEDGQAAAQALAANEQLVAAIGTTCSTTAVPAGPVLGDQGIVLISPSNTAPGLTDPEHDQYAGEFFMRTAHNDKIQGAAMATFVCEELGLTNAATIHDGSPYADQLQQVFADEFANQCEGEVTSQEAIAPTDTDFNSVLTTVAGDSPEFLYYPVFHPAGTLLTQQARDFPGLEETILAAADGLLVEDLLAQGGDAAEGMYLSGPDLAFSGELYENEFLPEYQEVSGEESPTSVFHAHAFDAANMIFAAVEQVGIEGDDGTLYIPRTELRDAMLATSGFEGITGTLDCDEFGDCADARISVSQVEGGEFNRIWPEE
ncbi:MAG TPA: branched-chain amino acid ABC transporter substrate-binding protein [Candidatus Limnocylindria bacterium]|nr:branched-chain amino acid ABC transporter substrate-binding protein [Candidatus Limnocylindria bacterium]